MKFKIGIILLVAAGGFAYLTGHLLGSFLIKKKTSDYFAKRAQNTESILEDHVQLGVGDTLPDYAFETLDFNTITFSEFVTDNTILVAVHPGCKTCVEEMSMIAAIQAEYNMIGPFVFISSANPRLLMDIKDSLQLGNIFLYDHLGKFLSHFSIDVYPMLLKVNGKRQVTEIILGSLLSEEIEEALDEKKTLDKKGSSYVS